MKPDMLIEIKNSKTAAEKIAQTLKGGEIMGLIGTLGAGKTTFVQHLGKVLNVKQRITSPGFSLMNIYYAKLSSGKKIYFYHLDLYRTRNFREVKDLGLTEVWGKKNVITIIEWANKINKHLPTKTRILKFSNEH